MIFEIEQKFENSSKLVKRAESLTLSFFLLLLLKNSTLCIGGSWNFICIYCLDFESKSFRVFLFHTYELRTNIYGIKGLII